MGWGSRRRGVALGRLDDVLRPFAWPCGEKNPCESTGLRGCRMRPAGATSHLGERFACKLFTLWGKLSVSQSGLFKKVFCLTLGSYSGGRETRGCWRPQAASPCCSAAQCTVSECERRKGRGVAAAAAAATRSPPAQAQCRPARPRLLSAAASALDAFCQSFSNCEFPPSALCLLTPLSHNAHAR